MSLLLSWIAMRASAIPYNLNLEALTHDWNNIVQCYDIFLQEGKYPLEGALGSLWLSLCGENSYIFHDYHSLHFKSSQCWASQQRKGQSCTAGVLGENIAQHGCQNFAHAICWWFVAQQSRYQRCHQLLPQEIRSVSCLEEHWGISPYLLDDVEVDDTLGCLSCMSEKFGSRQFWIDPVYGPFQSLLH